jgi:hypothetical protein
MDKQVIPTHYQAIEYETRFIALYDRRVTRRARRITPPALPQLWPFTRLSRPGDPSEPSLTPQTVSGPRFLQPCTRPFRERHRSLPVVPPLVERRYYGEAPVGLRRYERAVGDAVPPFHRTAKTRGLARKCHIRSMLRDPHEDYNGPAPGCHQHDAGAAGGTQDAQAIGGIESASAATCYARIQSGSARASFQTVTRSTRETNGISCPVAQGQ